jgi:hypothetical protein
MPCPYEGKASDAGKIKATAAGLKARRYIKTNPSVAEEGF